MRYIAHTSAVSAALTRHAPRRNRGSLVDIYIPMIEHFVSHGFIVAVPLSNDFASVITLGTNWELHKCAGQRGRGVRPRGRPTPLQLPPRVVAPAASKPSPRLPQRRAAAHGRQRVRPLSPRRADRRHQILGTIAWLEKINSINNGLPVSAQSPFSNFYHRIDLSRLGLAGHSVGAGVIVQARHSDPMPGTLARGSNLRLLASAA